MTTSPTAPVRVPNVSPGARSGLDHEVIGANAQEAHEVNQDLQDDTKIPEDLTEAYDRLRWVTSSADDEQAETRARAVLDAEKAKPESEQSATLVETLEAALAGEEPVPALPPLGNSSQPTSEGDSAGEEPSGDAGDPPPLTEDGEPATEAPQETVDTVQEEAAETPAEENPDSTPEVTPAPEEAVEAETEDNGTQGPPPHASGKPETPAPRGPKTRP